MVSAVRFARLGICALLAGSYASGAELPTPADLSTSALEGHLRGVEPLRLQQAIADEAREVREAAAATPDHVAGATVVFNQGMTPKALETLAVGGALEISNVELKVPIGTEGRVFTVWIGEQLLLLLDGPFGERLEKGIGRQRYEFLNLSRTAKGAEAEQFKELAYTPQMLAYKVHLLGPAKRIAPLLDDSSVAAVFLDETPDRVQGYQAVKNQYSSTKRHVIKGVVAPDPSALRKGGEPMPEGAEKAPVIRR